MVDKFSKRKRSEIMSHIKSKNTKPEITVRKIIYSLGYRYRLHRKDLPGKPDLAFIKKKKVIFINGCFWHGHSGCKKSALPDTNYEFWNDKIKKNVNRDTLNYKRLKDMGWKYLVIWQCEIKNDKLENIKSKIIHFLNE